MDKNKSAYKLKNLPSIYYLNLDSQPERREFMESQFKYWEIENYTRISAYDGRDDDLSEIISGSYPENMTSGEVGCVTSHLKAIKQWYETTNEPYLMVMEDDCWLEPAKYWDFSWSDFISRMPYCWDVLQLSIICTGNIHVTIHNRFVNDFSTACYVITRHHAKKLITYHVRGEKYKLDNNVRPRAVADDLIYNSGCTFSSPIFLYNLDLGSTIHPDHIESFHKASYEGILNFWIHKGMQLSIDQLTDYNPYLGRVTESTQPT
ncbi:glycosyltransferase family 25 protein [bacterium]|nr:glycosyltransferase family 25 protein [bacterium]